MSRMSGWAWKAASEAVSELVTELGDLRRLCG